MPTPSGSRSQTSVPKPPKSETLDRRRKERINIPFQVIVRCVDAGGSLLKTRTVVDNISPTGMYVRLPRLVKKGADLAATLFLYTGPPTKTFGARVSIRGVVLRVEPYPDGTVGVAVKFTDHRFIYAE